MLAELERLETGTGFLCCFSKAGYNQAVATLIQEPNTPETAKRNAIFQLNGYFADVNKGTQKASVNETPAIAELSENTNLDLAAETLLEGSQQKILFICSDWQIYARLCYHIGITRADHIALAQKGALMKDDVITANKGEKIKSDAKKFIKQLKRGQILEPLDMDSTKILDFAASIIDRAKIFNLGAEKWALKPDSENESWEYHLPYDACLFEICSANGEIRQFALVYVEDRTTWKVSSIWFATNTNDAKYNCRYALAPYKISYSPDDPLGSIEFETTPNSKTKNQDFSNEFLTGALKFIFPYIAAINKPTTTITRHKDPLQRMKRKGGAYAVHTIDFDPEDTQRTIVEKTKGQMTNTSQFTVAVHDRKAHKRRRPRTAIDAPKTVKVRATTVGHPKKGAVAKVFRAVEDSSLDCE